MAANAFNIGTANVQFSITNPTADISDVRDNFQPFSFFEYLKNTKQLGTPDLFTQAYNNYLHEWYNVKNVEVVDQQDEIRQRYVELLRDIAVNYTTQEEKRFLANIDYDNPSDLSIAIPFYTQKLKEICLFYARKRDEFKSRIEEVKIKGTDTSIERAIFRNIIDYLSTADGISPTVLTTAISSLQIDITEYVDEYSEYFNIDDNANATDLNIKNEIRAKYLTSNTNPISANLFISLKDSIVAEILSTPFYLKEIGQNLLINPAKLVSSVLNSSICSEQTLAQLINTSAESLSGEYLLKKKLIEKYIGTDFYYISTNSLSNYVSGALFRATNASGNLLNKRYATTASVPEDQLISLQRLGLFFKPDKMGIIQLAVPKKQFYIDESKIEPNKLYIFPDPTIYGNVSNYSYSNITYPLVYTIDNTVLSKGIDQGAARGNVKSSEYFQNFYAYFSEPVYLNSSNLNVSSFDANMMRVFNRGTFTSYAQDAWGNEYGVIKPINRYNRVQTDRAAAASQCITIDGYLFYDDLAGYSFNYALTGTASTGAIMTGLTAKTAENFPPGGGNFSSGYSAASAGMFTLTANKYVLYFREYSPFIECSTTDTYTCSIRDGGYFTASDSVLLPDVSSDSASWNTNSIVYYTTLCDAGISATNSLTPGTTAATLTAIVTAPALSSSLYEIFDGRYFPNVCTIAPTYQYNGEPIRYINDVNSDCISILQDSQDIGDENLNRINALSGVLLVKNAATNQVDTLSASLSATFAKYSEAVRSELYGNSVMHVNVYYDTLAIRTNNYLVFDKINVSDVGVFEKPGTANNYITAIKDSYTSLSNTFHIENQDTVWAYKTVLSPILSASNSKTIYPQIYKYNITTNKLERKYPGLFTTAQEISSLFCNVLSGINIIQVSDASLTYASLNDKFNATWTAIDLNGLSYIFSAWFDYINDEIVFDADQIAVYKSSTNAETVNFYYSLSTLGTSVVSAGNVNISQTNNVIFFNR